MSEESEKALLRSYMESTTAAGELRAALAAERAKVAKLEEKNAQERLSVQVLTVRLRLARESRDESEREADKLQERLCVSDRDHRGLCRVIQAALEAP